MFRAVSCNWVAQAFALAGTTSPEVASSFAHFGKVGVEMFTLWDDEAPYLSCRNPRLERETWAAM